MLKSFVIDLFYWFDKSTKRKNELRSYCIFCDQEYKRIVKHVFKGIRGAAEGAIV